MAHRAARERWYKAHIKRTSWQTDPNAWDQTSGSSDRVNSKPEYVTHHEGEEIQHIGCVYHNLRLESGVSRVLKRSQSSRSCSMTAPTIVQPDNVAVVTGAALGIGRAMCRRLAEAGMSVVVADLPG